MSIQTDRDFQELVELAVPAKRAAYSDRTAWLMAVLSELAYTPFDEESEHHILALATELAELSDQTKIAERLRNAQEILAGMMSAPQQGQETNVALRAALAVGGFELGGDRVIHDPTTDTQAYVAIRKPKGDDLGLAVICFRGTKQVRDWITNIGIAKHPIAHPKTGGHIGNMHQGFHGAYMAVHDDIAACLHGYEELPLYITGHSLGGALAVVATWYQSSAKLAACYTFGAPRAGDQGLIDKFKTPIYRVVNGPDPVPFVPPSGYTVDVFKGGLRILSSVLPFGGVIDWMVDQVIRAQKFRHYGYMRYMTVVDTGPDGDYFGLQVEFSLSSWRRLSRFVGLIRSGKGKATGIANYHDMSRYRNKLRAHAKRRNE